MSDMYIMVGFYLQRQRHFHNVMPGCIVVYLEYSTIKRKVTKEPSQIVRGYSN